MLIRVSENRKPVVVQDDFTTLYDIADVAKCSRPSVTPEFFLAHRDALKPARCALRLTTDSRVDPEIPYALFAQICIHFPSFVDGRGHSLARLLQRAGAAPRFRASGNILPDQLFYLYRCGFVEFELDDARGWTLDALDRFSEFSSRYQTAADGAVPVYLRS